MNLGIGAVEAIDTHVHVESDGHGHTALDQQLLDASARYFKAGVNRTPTLEEISDYYREWRLTAVVFTVDAHRNRISGAVQRGHRDPGGRARRRAHPVRVGGPARRAVRDLPPARPGRRRCTGPQTAPFAAGVRA